MNAAFWEALLDVINIESLRDPKFSKSVDRLKNQEFIESGLKETQQPSTIITSAAEYSFLMVFAF